MLPRLGTGPPRSQLPQLEGGVACQKVLCSQSVATVPGGRGVQAIQFVVPVLLAVASYPQKSTVPKAAQEISQANSIQMTPDAVKKRVTPES